MAESTICPRAPAPVSRSAPPAFGTVGALDLGGGSTQITMPATKGVAVPLPGSKSASVFTHSHLGYGNKQVLGALTPFEAAACLSSGAVAEWEASNASGGGARTLHGRGAFADCVGGVRRVLGAFEKHGQPLPQRAQRFVAMSLFFYSINFARISGHLHRDAPVTPRTLLSAARGLCQENDVSLRRMAGKDTLTPDDAIKWRCFDLVYAARLLLDGYGFEQDDAAIEFLGDVVSAAAAAVGWVGLT